MAADRQYLRLSGLLSGRDLQPHVRVLLARSGRIRRAHLHGLAGVSLTCSCISDVHLLYIAPLMDVRLAHRAVLGDAPVSEIYFQCGVVAGICVLIVNMLVGDWRPQPWAHREAVFGSW